ncbi:DNA circularization N-terminal domain-containing protein [Lichenihabitans sp. PAMC28606]|uniref:DNA circularization N-terminal domain-containing protein n=1 Tax=Lichenihabitans sp. PAMC28606 TaxID=2880932 RepID=UPI001D0B2B27|nr:DNA circularization N-terminal domain-containing protein [Lichenihabitans sp. PAMC28606]UDL95509.1 DNA circularization N-terminal domain-containing protein [Lichenihabitans sp. PAMC28606]
MRDWTKTLPNASFRGAPFFIESEELNEAGRRVAVHEYAKSEDHSTEDMGRKTRKFRMDAYIVGDNADADALAFVDLCSQAGDGVLVMPVLGYQTVKCTGCNASSEKMKLGYVKMSLEFVESGNDSAFSVVALGDRIAASLQGSMAAAIVSTISGFTG